MSSLKIKKDMQLIRASIMSLSNEVGRASTLWNDKKFSELYASITEVAKQSKNVIVAADRCCCSVDKFEKIALEND